jgi:hypothetical protein
MGKLSKEAIEEFRELYKKNFEKEISYPEAEIKAEQLMRIYMLALPIKPKRIDKPLKSPTINKVRTNKKLTR